MNEIQNQAVIIPENQYKDAQPLVKCGEQSSAITPAQAKIDAIANLTMSAYQKAATLEITPEESANLQADFPDEAFQPGAAGKENLIYIEHAHLRDRFNEVFGMGKWAIVPRNRWNESFTTAKGTPGERIYVEAMLVVRGCFVGEAVGAMEYYPKNESQNYGDAVEGAKTAAFRRCAKEFGVGLQAWKKEWCEGWWQRRRGQGKKAAVLQHPPPQNAPNRIVERSTPIVATDAHRNRLIELLTPLGPASLEYCQKCGLLLPTEELKDLPLRFVPATVDQKDAFMAAVQAFVDGGEAKKPDYCNDEPITKSLDNIRKAAQPAGNRIVGLVQAVSEKPGTNKKGKPYLKIGVKIADGWLNSFDSKIAEICNAAKDSGDEVDIEYKETKFGREIVSCIPVPPQDDLPI